VKWEDATGHNSNIPRLTKILKVALLTPTGSYSRRSRCALARNTNGLR
jgi:hypothetical protein